MKINCINQETGKTIGTFRFKQIPYPTSPIIVFDGINKDTYSPLFSETEIIKLYIGKWCVWKITKIFLACVHVKHNNENVEHNEPTKKSGLQKLN